MSETNRAWVLFFVLATVWVVMSRMQPAEQIVDPGAESAVEEETFSDLPESRVDAGQADGQWLESGGEAVAAREIMVRTEQLEVVLSTRGSGIAAARVLDYSYGKGHMSAGEPIVVFDGREEGRIGGVYRLDAVGGPIELGRVVMECPAGDEVSVSGEDSLQITMTGTLPDGGRVTRDYFFRGTGHSFESRLEYAGSARVGSLELLWGLPLALTETYEKMDKQNQKAMVMVDADLESVGMGSVDKGEVEQFSGAIDWVGARTRYFMVGLMPWERGKLSASVRGILGEGEGKGFELRLKRRGINATSVKERVRFFIGPLDYVELRELGRGMDEAVEFVGSVLRPIAEVIFDVMVWLRRYIPSYGVVIIVISLLVKILFWPLSKKSFESSRRMKAIAPEVEALKAKYKNNMQKQQQETMKLYKERGVNPLGGCLPMLLQMPVLYALFIVFRSTIAFRGEPFLYYILDLSAPDPYWILPLLMGATMLLQQKVMGQMNADPRQKMMMYMMPVVFTFIFLNMPSGLVLYWTVSNMASVAQQAWTNWRGGAAA